MFKLRDYEREEEKAAVLNALKTRLEALPAAISQIRAAEIGINVRKLNWAYDLVLVMEFDKLEDVETYTVHPAHQEFVAFNADKSVMKALVDYEV